MFDKHDCDKCDKITTCEMEEPLRMLRKVLRAEGLAKCCTTAVTLMNEAPPNKAIVIYTCMIALASDTPNPPQVINTFVFAAYKGYKEPNLIRELSMQVFEDMVAQMRKSLHVQIQTLGAAFGFEVSISRTPAHPEEQKLDNPPSNTVEPLDWSNFQGTKH